jgi:hypothetical protein
MRLNLQDMFVVAQQDIQLNLYIYMPVEYLVYQLLYKSKYWTAIYMYRFVVAQQVIQLNLYIYMAVEYLVGL